MSVISYPRTLADQNRKLVMIVDPVDDLSEIPVSVLNDETTVELSCRATQADTRFAATASETMSDPAVCEDSGVQTIGASQWEGNLGLFRFFDEAAPGQADAEGDKAYKILSRKGTEVTIVERHSNVPWDEPFAEGQEIRAFKVEADNWIVSSEPH